MREKTVSLLTADTKTITALTREIQKLRVVVQVLSEIEGGKADQNTYREMSLLNRMVTGHDLDGEVERERAEEEASLSQRLESRGIQPESAMRMARVLEGVFAKGTAMGDGEYE